MLSVTIVPGTALSRLRCEGVLDAATAADFARSAEAVLASGGRVVADLSDLVLLDSSGVAALSHLVRRLAETGRRLDVEGLRGQPLMLLRSVGLDRVLGAAAPREGERPLRLPLWALGGRA